MKVLTLEEADLCVAGWGLSSFQSAKAELINHQGMLFRLPVDSGVKSALSRYLVYNVLDGLKCVTEIFDEDVFEHRENTYLFEVARRGMGEARNLRTVSHHLTIPEDELQLQALLSMTMFFIWSAAVITERADLSLFISHDEYLEVRCLDTSRATEIEATLKKFCAQP